MGVITRGLVTKSIVAPAQGIFVVQDGGVQLGGTSTVASINAAKFSPNDLLVAIVVTTSNPAITFTPPAGWTEVLEQGALPNLNIAYKIATPADIGSSPIWTASTAASGILLMVGFRGAQWDAVGAVVSGSGNSTIQIPSVTTSANNSIVAAIYAGASVSAPTPQLTATRGFVFLGTFSSPSGALIEVGYKLQPTIGIAPQLTNITWGGAASGGGNAGVQLSVKPR